MSTGSSPRLRGTVDRPCCTLGNVRFIPAPAGNGTFRKRYLKRYTVHPRACGERYSGDSLQHRFHGSSPRLRGTVVPPARLLPRTRFIPAPAGNGRNQPATGYRLSVHPRACGERVWHPKRASRQAGSSPRLRGTANPPHAVPLDDRFIPAPAGNGWNTSGTRAPSTVHPRACGERYSSQCCRPSGCGSSPRLRGTERQSGQPYYKERFIPAPAGNGAEFSLGMVPDAVHPRACGERTNHYVIDGV